MQQGAQPSHLYCSWDTRINHNGNITKMKKQANKPLQNSHAVSFMIFLEVFFFFFQRNPEYYCGWAQQDSVWGGGKRSSGSKHEEHDVTCKTERLSQPNMTGRPVLHPADKTGSRTFTFNSQTSGKWERNHTGRCLKNKERSKCVCLCERVCGVCDWWQSCSGRLCELLVSLDLALAQSFTHVSRI